MADLNSFEVRALAWLEQHVERRAPTEDVRWGEGSDSVALFKNLTFEEERAHIDALRDWQRAKSDAGYGSIIWPVIYGGAGLSRDYEPAPGVEVRPLRQMSGGSSFNEVLLDDVAVPDSNRLGAVGAGWSVAITTLGFERAAATRSATSGGDLFDRLILLARHVGRDTDPVLRQRLAAIYTNGRVRALTRRRVSAAVRGGGTPGPEGSIGKLAWTEGLRDVAELAGELLGPSLVADSGEWGTFA